jgi:hypothetical protein
VDHEAKDTHHSGAAVVELDSTLGELGLLIEGVPAEVDGTVTEVTNKFTRLSTIGGVLHDTKLQEANEGKDLGNSGSRDGGISRDGSPAVGERVEGIARVVDISAKVEASAGGDLAKEGKLGDTSMLDLDLDPMLKIS